MVLPNIQYFIPTAPSAEATSNCLTTRGKHCVFPFTYKGKTYHQCTFDHPSDDSRNGQSWCGTRGYVEYPNWDGVGWGYCGDGCTIPGKESLSPVS